MALVEANVLLVLLGIHVNLSEPKAFYGDSKQVQSWLSAVKHYFQTVGLEEDEASNSIRMCYICSPLM